MDEFSLAEHVVKNLAKIHINKLFPVQVYVGIIIVILSGKDS